jgi:hypothetical protein
MIIPKYEPEFIAAEAKRLWHGDDEKVPTTSLQEVVFRGVRLDSRYQKAHEFEAMIAAASRFNAEEIAVINSIWCNSKAYSCYEVMLKRGVSEEWADIIRASFATHLIQTSGGYNGFDVVDIDGNELAFEDPCWPEYDNE